MQKCNQTILGISPGNRYTGIAIIKNGELLEWCTKTFNEAWSTSKLIAILNCIDDFIEKYSVNAIALKISHLSRTSDEVTAVIEGIKELAIQECISIQAFTIEDIKEQICQETKSNMFEIMELLSVRHNELRCEYNKEVSNLNPYYRKVFEAVAVASMVKESAKGNK